MKKYLIGGAIIAVLIAIIVVEYVQYNKVNEKWKTAEANVKNYNKMLSSSDNKCAAFELTVKQLEYFQDSILTELDNTRKELDIKDKNLKALQHVSSSFSKSDTIYLDSIVFKEPEFALDTIMGDNWYSVQLGLKYPSMIAVTPEFKSEKDIIVSTKRETVNPPKKCWLLRLFQKKHDVLQVNVVEKNPYVTGESSKYVEIIK